MYIISELEPSINPKPFYKIKKLNFMSIQELICALFKLGATCPSWPMDKLLIEYLFVPSVILIILLAAVANLFKRDWSIKIEFLLCLVFYTIIVYSGWYGIVAPLLYNFAALFLIGGIFLFLLTRIISPAEMMQIGKVARALGEKRYDVRLIMDRIRIKKDEIKDLMEMAKKYRDEGTINKNQYAILEMLAQEAKRELELLENQARRGKSLAPSLFGSSHDYFDKGFERVDSIIEKMDETLSGKGEDKKEKVFKLVEKEE